MNNVRVTICILTFVLLDGFASRGESKGNSIGYCYTNTIDVLYLGLIYNAGARLCCVEANYTRLSLLDTHLELMPYKIIIHRLVEPRGPQRSKIAYEIT